MDRAREFDYFRGVERFDGGNPVPGSTRAALGIVGAVLLSVLYGATLAQAQQASPRTGVLQPGDHRPAESAFPPAATLSTNYDFSSPLYLHQFSHVRLIKAEPDLLVIPQTWSPGMVERMESAFSCNDTPFIDQVRLPVATLWRGRVRLTGFESDVTTANFVLGLPGAGTLPSLSMFGSGHLATHTPPSDQLVGMHLTFYMRSAEPDEPDNSGLRGVQHLVRSGREFFQTFMAH